MTTNPTGVRLSRRKVLAGLGTIGIASAGAGLGTTAFLSDEEGVSAELEAGRLDLKLDYRATYTPWNRPDFESRSDDLIPGTDKYVLKQVPDLRDDGVPVSEQSWGEMVRFVPCTIPGLVDGQNGDDGMMFDLRDVKPKDEGEVTLSMHLCDNPAHLWVRTLKRDDVDGPVDGSLPAIVEPEDASDGVYDGADGTADGDLDDYTYVEVWYDRDCDNVHSDGPADDEVFLYKGSMAGFLELGAGGIPLDFGADTECEILADPSQATPFPTSTSQLTGETGGVHCIALRWYLPCYAEQADGDGFTQLDSCFVPDGSGGYTTGSLADELVARGVLADIADLDINVVQTDGYGFGLDVAAVQSRHNMANANPFGRNGSSVTIEAIQNDEMGGVDSVHRVEVTVGSDLDGQTLDSMTIDYPNGVGFDVSGATVSSAGVQEGGGAIGVGTVTESVDDGDTRLSLTFDGGAGLDVGDVIFLEYGPVVNGSKPAMPYNFDVDVGVDGSPVGTAVLELRLD